MAVWLTRAGSHGEYEQKFVQENRVYVTWHGLDVNLVDLPDRAALTEAMTKRYPDDKSKAILNYVGQVWPFAHEMKTGDLVVLPSKVQPVLYIGEVTGEYRFEPKADDPYFHWRSVNWVGNSVPRSNFGQDLLYSLGAFMTICRIQRNDAEIRIRAMLANGWKPETISGAVAPKSLTNGEPQEADLEVLAQDQIARLIGARFKGHDLTRLVEAVLKAQGYSTYRSPEGADSGTDILAGTGPLGFGSPRLCVEVKSESTPIDRPTVDKLLGALQRFKATEGLFVSWSGFKNNVQRELSTSFFNVRLWSQKELLEQVFANYGELDEDIRAELPLKRIWTVALNEEE